MAEVQNFEYKLISRKHAAYHKYGFIRNSTIFSVLSFAYFV